MNFQIIHTCFVYLIMTKFFEFGPLITKVRHNLAHFVLYEIALISIPPPSPTALIFIARLLL